MIEEQTNEYLEYCAKVRGMTEATMAMKRNVLMRFRKITGVKDVGEIDNIAFDGWTKQLTETRVRPRSLNMYNSIVIAMVRYFRGMGVNVPLNLNLIVKQKDTRPVRKYYTAEEVRRVAEKAGEMTALQVIMLFETGMRIAELARLRVGDIDGRRVEFVGKGRKWREVYITEETRERAERYVARYNIEGYMWCVTEGDLCGTFSTGVEVYNVCGVRDKTLNGMPLTTNTIRAHLKQAFLAAGFEGFYPHALRHSFATDLQRRGATVAEIKEMMGHESIATTERYLHGFEGRLEELFLKYRG